MVESGCRGCITGPVISAMWPKIATRGDELFKVSLNRVALFKVSLNRVQLFKVTLNRVDLFKVSLNRVDLFKDSLNRVGYSRFFEYNAFETCLGGLFKESLNNEVLFKIWRGLFKKVRLQCRRFDL